MPAPPKALIAGLRHNTLARVLLFRLAHASGTVRAWSGRGTFVFEGETYLGVSGMASIDGVSQSRDIQNHEVLVTLNGVPLSSFIGDHAEVRNAVAKITALWLDKNGGVVGSRVLFQGLGDNMRSRLTGDALSLTVKLRGAYSDWSNAPRAYYTTRDQQILYPGDTGFNYVKSLENATVSGWSVDTEVTASKVIIAPTWLRLMDTVSGELIGSNTFGMNFGTITGTFIRTLGGDDYKEQTSEALASQDPSTYYLRVGGLAVGINVSDEVQTQGGLKVLVETDATSYLRKQATIASAGTATSETIDMLTFNTRRSLFRNSIGNPSGNNKSGMIYDNKSGPNVIVPSGSSTPQHYSAGGNYVENVTGTTVTVNGSNKLVAGANECRVSSTGAIVTTSNNVIYRSGGDPAVDFLRVWS